MKFVQKLVGGRVYIRGSLELTSVQRVSFASIATIAPSRWRIDVVRRHLSSTVRSAFRLLHSARAKVLRSKEQERLGDRRRVGGTGGKKKKKRSSIKWRRRSGSPVTTRINYPTTRHAAPCSLRLVAAVQALPAAWLGSFLMLAGCCVGYVVLTTLLWSVSGQGGLDK